MIPANQNPKGAVYKIKLEVTTPVVGVNWESDEQEITAKEDWISLEIR